MILVSNGRVQQVFDNPDVGGAVRPQESVSDRIHPMQIGVMLSRFSAIK